MDVVACAAHDGCDPAIDAAMSVEKTAPANSSSPRLLIVEDDNEIVEVLRRYFSGQGFDVSTASNGVVMRETLGAKVIDVVLLDLGLPGEDGFALTRYLRENWKVALIIV